MVYVHDILDCVLPRPRVAPTYLLISLFVIYFYIDFELSCWTKCVIFLFKAKVALKCGQVVKVLEEARGGAAGAPPLHPRCIDSIDQILEQLSA